MDLTDKLGSEDAAKEAKVAGKAEKFAEAKARIEMIAGARGYLRFRREWACDQEVALRAAGNRASFGGRQSDFMVHLPSVLSHLIIRLPVFTVHSCLPCFRFARVIVF